MDTHEDEYTEIAHYYAERALSSNDRRVVRMTDQALQCRTQDDVLLEARDMYVAMRRALASNGLDY